MERQDVSVGERPVVSMDVTEAKVRLEWNTSLLLRRLDYDIDKCVGCSLCLPCPWEAITLGPVAETAAGRIEGAPLVMVDPDICTFCGLCDSACVFKAFDASYEGESAINEFVRIDGVHVVDNEKCAPCLLCAKVCPTGALEVDVKVDHKKDLVVYRGDVSAEGTIKIDEDKCSYCGLCEILCPEAIKIFWSESAEPPDFRPAVGIRVVEEECDYCGLCEGICPDDAIKVECTKSSSRKITEPKISGELRHDDEKCVKCSLCAGVCPYDAIKVEKPFSGEVKVQHLERCDPTGCVNCFNICPVKAIYPTGTESKLEVLDGNCIYCGACENACPDEVLVVSRSGYKLDELERAREWEKARKHFFDAVVGIEKTPSGLFERDLNVVEARQRPQDVAIDDEWDTEDGVRAAAKNLVGSVSRLLSRDPSLQMHLERGRTEKVIEKIKEQSKGSPKK
ncbi:MAG: 4Fe-4S binding protein [Candidatus Thorarchaeota archaeon]|nr:MAG: 4Fe-4S binding protein [Candidatus Thorarchaeota archaeon]